MKSKFKLVILLCLIIIVACSQIIHCSEAEDKDIKSLILKGNLKGVSEVLEQNSSLIKAEYYENKGEKELKKRKAHIESLDLAVQGGNLEMVKLIVDKYEQSSKDENEPVIIVDEKELLDFVKRKGSSSSAIIDFLTEKQIYFDVESLTPASSVFTDENSCYQTVKKLLVTHEEKLSEETKKLLKYEEDLAYYGVKILEDTIPSLDKDDQSITFLVLIFEECNLNKCNESNVLINSVKQAFANTIEKQLAQEISETNELLVKSFDSENQLTISCAIQELNEKLEELKEKIKKAIGVIKNSLGLDEKILQKQIKKLEMLESEMEERLKTKIKNAIQNNEEEKILSIFKELNIREEFDWTFIEGVSVRGTAADLAINLGKKEMVEFFCNNHFPFTYKEAALVCLMKHNSSKVVPMMKVLRENEQSINFSHEEEHTQGFLRLTIAFGKRTDDIEKIIEYLLSEIPADDPNRQEMIEGAIDQVRMNNKIHQEGGNFNDKKNALINKKTLNMLKEAKGSKKKTGFERIERDNTKKEKKQNFSFVNGRTITAMGLFAVIIFLLWKKYGNNYNYVNFVPSGTGDAGVIS